MSRVVVAVAAFVAGLVPAIAVAQVDPPAPAPTPIVTGCVIRLYDTGPEIHDDAWHDCTGADTVGLDAQGDLYITSSHATPVVSVTAAVDESLARRGILAGASGGVGWTEIRLYDADSGQAVAADSSAVTCSYCNIWVTWVHAPAPESEECTGTGTGTLTWNRARA